MRQKGSVAEETFFVKSMFFHVGRPLMFVEAVTVPQVK
jgi:hypothetical protein